MLSSQIEILGSSPNLTFSCLRGPANALPSSQKTVHSPVILLNVRIRFSAGLNGTSSLKTVPDSAPFPSRMRGALGLPLP